jgi:bacterioferritin-associated ferredoxin
MNHASVWVADELQLMLGDLIELKVEFDQYYVKQVTTLHEGVNRVRRRLARLNFLGVGAACQWCQGAARDILTPRHRAGNSPAVVA